MKLIHSSIVHSFLTVLLLARLQHDAAAALSPSSSTADRALTKNSVRRGGRGESFVKHPRNTHRQLDSDDDEEESPMAPKARDCKMAEKTSEVTFECKSKTENGAAEIKDEIDFTVAATGRGLKVKVQYEQEVEVEVEEEEEAEDGEEGDDENEDEPDNDNDNEKEEDTDEQEDEPDAEETEEEGENEDNENRRALQEAEQETETSFEVYFDTIIEYAKSDNSNGEAYDWENDEILQTIDLTSWTDFSSFATDGSTTTFEVMSPDGTVHFAFTINEAGQGASMTANKMKIDFELKDFPWTSDNSYVALLSTVETEQEVDVEYDGDEDSAAMLAAKDVLISFATASVSSDSVTPIGEYSWVETAEAQRIAGESTADTVSLQSAEGAASNVALPEIAVPQTIRVIATSPAVESERRRVEGKTTRSIAFSFVGDAAHKASDIFWDPTAGVTYSGSSSAYSSSAWAVGASSVVGIVASLVAMM